MNEPARRVSLSAFHARDEGFVFEVFVVVRGARFAAAGLPESAVRQLLKMQYRAQQAHYRAQYPAAELHLVLVDDEPVGYLCVERGQGRFALVDIALLPAHCGRGVGSEVVGAFLREAEDAGKPVIAHVEKGNRAWQLWQRLGFEVTGDDGVHLAIERRV